MNCPHGTFDYTSDSFCNLGITSAAEAYQTAKTRDQTQQTSCTAFEVKGYGVDVSTLRGHMARECMQANFKP